MSKHILVVEDQADNRQIIRDMLAPTDYEITEAENGGQALAVVAKQRPIALGQAGAPGRHSVSACDRAQSRPLEIKA